MINLKKYWGWLVLVFTLGALVLAFNEWDGPLVIQNSGQASAPVATNAKPASLETHSKVLQTKKNPNQLSTEELLQNLINGYRHGNKYQFGLENTLIERLCNEEGGATYKVLLAQFRQGTLPIYAQNILLSLLGQVGTYQAAETLMSLVNENLLQDNAVKLSAIQAIGKFAPELWHENPHTELAPVFEAAWQTQNAAFWPAIAKVMASISTPATLDIFLATLNDNSNPQRIAAVNKAMTSLVNPALVPKLADTLANATSPALQMASGAALAHMGELMAATALFDWSTQADATKTNLVSQWIDTAVNTTPEFVGYLEANLAGQKFAAPEIKQTIIDVLATVQHLD